MSKIQKHRVRRYHRAEYAREVQIFIDSETTLHGLTRDLTPDSVSIFLSLKGAQHYLKASSVKRVRPNFPTFARNWSTRPFSFPSAMPMSANPSTSWS